MVSLVLPRLIYSLHSHIARYVLLPSASIACLYA